MIGTFNFNKRSFKKKGDIEIGYVSSSDSLINSYKNLIQKDKKKGYLISEKNY